MAGLNLPGLRGQPAQNEGSAGTQTTGPENSAKDAAPKSEERQAQDAANAVAQGQGAPPPKNPVEAQKPSVDGVSASLLSAVELEKGGLGTFEEKVGEELAIQAAVTSGAGIESRGTLYSCHPVQNYRLGRFHFEKTLLRLDDEDSAEFEKLLEKLPPLEKNRIQKIDEGRAAAIVKDRIEGQATKQFDSSVGGDTAARVRQLGPTVGTTELGARNQDLGFANRAQQDMNAPLVTDKAVDPKGESGLDQGPHTEDSATKD